DKDVRRPPRRVAQHILRDKLRVRRRIIVSLLLLGGIIVSSAREADALAWRSFHSSPYDDARTPSLLRLVLAGPL
ncbi:MAG: hypothetical protein WBD90_16620, partial [Xanthobacteraceae bacterium]